jgi:hypothetical protein
VPVPALLPAPLLLLALVLALVPPSRLQVVTLIHCSLLILQVLAMFSETSREQYLMQLKQKWMMTSLGILLVE